MFPRRSSKSALAVGVMVIPGKARTFRRGRPVRQFPRLMRLGATPKMGALQTSLRVFKAASPDNKYLDLPL